MKVFARISLVAVALTLAHIHYYADGGVTRTTEEVSIGPSWVSTPEGDDSVSFKGNTGPEIEYTHSLSKHIALSASYSQFMEQFHYDGVLNPYPYDLSRSCEIQIQSLGFAIQYQILPDKIINPYVGIGVCHTWSNTSEFFAWYYNGDITSFTIVLEPRWSTTHIMYQAGLRVVITKNVGVNLDFKYIPNNFGIRVSQNYSGYNTDSIANDLKKVSLKFAIRW